MATDSFRAAAQAAGEVAHIGSSVLIKGELSGNEDLYVDGEVEGTVELRDFVLTIGAQGRVHANVHAKNVIVQGKVEGDITANQKVELRKSAIVTGNIRTHRIVIEDGASFKGKIEMAHEQRAEKSTGASTPATAAAPASNSAIPPKPAATGISAQGSLLDKV